MFAPVALKDESNDEISDRLLARLNALTVSTLLETATVGGRPSYSLPLSEYLRESVVSDSSSAFSRRASASKFSADARSPLPIEQPHAAASTTLLTQQGAGEHSLSLNGTTSYVEAPNSQSLNLTGAFTAEAWLKPNQSTGAYQSIFERYGAPDPSTGRNGGFILRLKPGGTLEFFVLLSNQAGHGLSGATVVTSGVWHHIAAVCDGSQLRVYLDGTLEASLNVGTYPGSGTSNLFIGKGTWNGGHVNGLIDEARITATALYHSDFTPVRRLRAGAQTRGLWKFDGQSFNDSSANANHAAPQGGASFSTQTPTPSDHSVNMNGAGVVRVPHSTSIDINGPITLETWFKLNNTSGGTQLISRQTGTGAYFLISNAGMPQLYLSNSSGYSDFAICAPIVNAGEWHHMAGVFDGSQMRVYLNGALCAAKNTGIVPGGGTGELTLGGFKDGTSATLDGSMDEVRISAGALYTSNFTPQRHLMQAPTTRGLWKLDGQTAQDSSGNGNHATLSGGVSYSADTPDVEATRVARWKFDEGAGVTAADATEHGSNGTLYGATWSAGRVGAGALNFDGVDDRVVVTSGAGMTDIANDFTLSFWAYPRSTHQIDPEDTTGSGGTSGQRYAYDPRYRPGSDAGVGVSVGTNGVSIYEHAYWYMPATLVHQATLTNWTHITLVYQNKQPRLYVNGSLVRTGLTSPRSNVFIRPLDIGGMVYGYFDGQLDDVRLYSRTLTAGEVQSLFKSYPAPTNQPPAVSLTSPADNSTFANASNIQINADSTDADGHIARVEFFQNGIKLGEDTSAPFAYAWNNVPAGSYALTAKASDNSGATTTSNAVNATVTLPSVSISPTDTNASEQGLDPATFNVSRTGGTSAPLVVNYTLSGTATNGVDYTSLGGALTIPADSSSQQVTIAPLDDTLVEGVETVTLTLANSSAYTLGSTTSATAHISDNDTFAPTVQITSPASGTIYTTPASFVVNATASDSDGQITKVEFFQGSTRLGEDAAAPYSFNWSGVSAGSYSLTARATDNMGATATSSAVSVVVNQPPTANAGGPYTGLSGAAIQFNAGGSTDADGTITSYVWNFGDGSHGSGANPTHAYASYGTYTATLSVTDDRGAQASATAIVMVSTPSGNGAGLRGRYFDQIDFNDFKISRVDAALNFEWAGGSPHPSMGVETFAVQWTGQVVPRYSEVYTFYTHSDDGVKLWVNNQLLIDNWTEHAYTENSAQITLVAGRQYDIRVEYFENYGGAVAKLLWSSQSQPKEVIPQSQLYPCWKSSEQFIRDFYQGVLMRQPDPVELQHWRERLAQARGGALLLEEARELGRSLFRSAEYAARSRDSRQYVGDLYRGFLQREAAEDQAGWDYWTNQVNADPAGGRASALGAFEQSGEFAEKVDKLCDISVSSSGYNFSAARIEPSNRTGEPGADLRSGNYHWSVPLLGLPGRSGLDLGLSLSYNSLVWTRDGSGTAISFDADRGFPSPGFRLGFPVVQPRFYNPQTERYAYLLVAPSGQRVELRQVAGSANTFESADSTYTQLIDNGDGSLTLRTPDGARLSYWLMGGDYLCTEIRDRNGNFITIRYDGYGQLQSVTDTLARTVNFRYDAYQNLISIWQTWTVNGQQQEHVYATFGYADRSINTNFQNMTVVGPHNGEVLPLLTQVGLDDGSYYKFEYTSWGQVSKITHYAADSSPQSDNHPLSYTSYNLPQDNAAPHADCPRFSERREWAENWKGDEGDRIATPSEEAVTSYRPDPSGAGAWCEVTMPDRTTVYKEYFGTGWQKALTMKTETYELQTPGSALPLLPKKTSVVNWKQDNMALPYPDNPRAEETIISDDEGNRRKTKTEYLPPSVSAFRLPSDTYEYKAETNVVVRRTHTEYNLDAPYLDRRIIGLVREQYLYGEDPSDGSEKLLSKTTYHYDEGGEFLRNDGEPVQHDAAYGLGFVLGRANLTSVRRWDVEHPDALSQSVEQKIGYNTTGSVVFFTDPLGHRTEIDYADKFADDESSEGANRNTLAYPTASTDPDQHAQPSPKKSRVWYNFDRGLVTRTQDLKDSVKAYSYDAANRIKEAVILFNRAKTRWEYPADFSYVHQYSTSEAGQGEFHSWQVKDGAGRVISKASDHPGGAGGYRAQDIVYDEMGRVIKTSTPTAVNASWEPQDEDATDALTAGWHYQEQSYDWMGRPLVSTNPDADATTREILYGGCGCAGGQVVTIRDEVGRRQRQTFDALGRLWKVQDLSIQPKHEALSASGSVYRTTVNVYNGRNQIVESQVFAGDAETDPAKIQKTLMSYDGHGRLKTSQAPLQTNATAYFYNPDDTLRQTTDARGVTTTYAYNRRHMTRRVEYSVPSSLSDVAQSAPVEMDYDAAGNRLWMTDESGRVDYEYNTLSQMIAESRRFNGLDASFQLTYGYTAAGQLKYLSQTGATRLDYSYDTAGRLLGVTGTGFSPSTQVFASDLRYLASGALKSLSYGNTTSLSLSYDQRGLPVSYSLSGVKNAAGEAVPEGGDFQYYADGRLKFASDLLSRATNASINDRAYAYDQMGRLKEAYSGVEARSFAAVGGSYQAEGAFRQSYGYDVWNNMTSREGRFWSQPDNTTETYTNQGRNPSWEYDAAGHLVSRNEPSPDGLPYQPLRNSYDAAGRPSQTTQKTSRRLFSGTLLTTTKTKSEVYDGDGLIVQSSTTTQRNANQPSTSKTYYLRSSVLDGRLIADFDAAGIRQNSYILAVRTLLARQQRQSDGTQRLVWEQTNPLTGDQLETDSQGKTEALTRLDPLGVDVGESDPFETPDAGGEGAEMANPGIEARVAQLLPGSMTGGTSCYLDGFETTCSLTDGLLAGGAAAQCPDNICSGVNRAGFYVTYRAYADGRQGYLPTFMDWVGDGFTIFGEFISLEEIASAMGVMPDMKFYFTPPQNHGQDNKTDCERFADIVAQLASEWREKNYGVWVYNASGFRDALYERFNNRSREGFNYNEFGSTGFRPEFRDDTPARPGGHDNSPNQVYHYVGAFRAGFSGGTTGGGLVMDNHENNYIFMPGPYPIPIGRVPDTPSHRADKALNQVAVRHGSAVSDGNIRPDQLANAIRRDVCASK